MKWFALEIGDQTWTVHLVPRADLARGRVAPRDAECRYSDCAIRISDALPRDARNSALVHELLHAILFVSGANAAYGDEADVEERIVLGVTPLLHAILRARGFRFPRVKR